MVQKSFRAPDMGIAVKKAKSDTVTKDLTAGTLVRINRKIAEQAASILHQGSRIFKKILQTPNLREESPLSVLAGNQMAPYIRVNTIPVTMVGSHESKPAT